MKKALIVLLLIYGNNSFGQSLKKYAIDKSGCSAYFFCNPGTFDVDNSPDSSTIYTADCKVDESTHGIICIKLLSPVTDLDSAEELLEKYLDYLKGSFEIRNAAGYGKGHRLKDNKNTRGIIDYWEGMDDVHWKVKGWTDGNYLAVMYVFSKKAIVETKANVFLDGFRLPGM